MQLKNQFKSSLFQTHINEVWASKIFSSMQASIALKHNYVASKQPQFTHILLVVGFKFRFGLNQKSFLNFLIIPQLHSPISPRLNSGKH